MYKYHSIKKYESVWGTILIIYGNNVHLVSVGLIYLHCVELETNCNKIRCMSSSHCKPIIEDYKNN